MLPKSINRYVPEKVNQFISNSNFKNKEHLYIICDMLYRISIYRKEETDYSNQFIDIPRHYFKDIISSEIHFSAAMDFLLMSEVILTDNVYSKEAGKAKGYKFKDEYISKLVIVTISKPTLARKIISNKNSRNNFVNEKYKTYKEYYLNTFTIDYKKAIEHLNNWFESTHSTLSINLSLCAPFLKSYIKLINQYNSIFISLSAINDGDLFFKKNSTNGRIDTNLTSLKKVYKKFITTKNLWSLDITNSQPFLLSIALNNLSSPLLDPEELKIYTRVTSKGLFYEYFIDGYFKHTGVLLNRKDIKTMMFCIIYSKNQSYVKEKRVFKMMFPTILKWVEKQKERNHNQLAIQMQKMESEICIDIICDELNVAGIEYYTVHDSWIVKKKDLSQTRKIINQCFLDKYKTCPTLDEEALNSLEEKEVIFD